MDELRRRGDFGVGPDRPGAIVEVKFRQDVGKINIGRPIRIQRSHVPPVAALVIMRPNARAAETMSYGAPMLDNVGDDILAEVMTRIRIFRVTSKLFKKEF